MSIKLIQEKKSKQYNVRFHRQIWKNIKDLLKSCVGLHSKTRLFNDDGSLIDPNRLRESICNNDQSYKQRQKTWPYLLNIYTPSMTNSDKKIYKKQLTIRYNKLKRRWQERISRGDSFYIKLADTILKDIRRTDQHIQFFKKKKTILFNIMMTYCVYHPNPGYSQGMTDMLTPIVYIFLNESESYFAYCSLMTRYMNILFDYDQIEINRRFYLFNLIIQSIDNELWKKLNINDNNSSFIYRWLLLDCKREFYKFNHVLRILEIVWIYSIYSNILSLESIRNNQSLFTVFLSISILQEDRQILLSYSNEEDLYKYFFSFSSLKRSHRSIKQILQRAQIYYLNYTSTKK